METKPTPRMQQIIDAIYLSGQSTNVELAKLVGMSREQVCKMILEHKKKRAKPNIRFCGKLRTSRTKLSKLYEISDEPDLHIVIESIEIYEDEDMLFEKERQERLARLSKLIKPFRDPMLFLTAGMRP
jgi:hypothetical protein